MSWPIPPPGWTTGKNCAAAPGWATTSYEPGDVIIFHCLTPHAALPNQGSALRISGEQAPAAGLTTPGR